MGIKQSEYNTMLLENEIVDVRNTDSLILNDVETTHSEQVIFIPVGIFYILSFMGLIYFDKMNSDLVSGYVIGLIFITLVIIPSRLRIRKNIKLFNSSKSKLEKVGMCLYRNKTRNLIDPTQNLIKIGNISEIEAGKYIIMPNGYMNLNDYKRHLTE